VVAYDVLKAIYLERGYQPRAIPRLILERNLYGLDIDDRAAQLAGFALLMKARADDRRLLAGPIELNVLSLQESAGMDLDEFAGHLKSHGMNRTALGSLLDSLAHAKTFGSLIQIPKVLEDGLAGLEDGIAKAIEGGDVFARAAAQDLVPLVRQAKILAMKFDAVVANPPYMGSQYFTDAEPLAKLALQG
jgi:type II restriction/modification system DNA methylase subunit YeeA